MSKPPRMSAHTDTRDVRPDCNTVVLPAPWSLCFVVAGGAAAAVIAAVFNAWYVLAIDWLVVIILVFHFGRPWGGGT